MQFNENQWKSIKSTEAPHAEYDLGFLGEWDYNNSEHPEHKNAWSWHVGPKNLERNHLDLTSLSLYINKTQ